MKHRIALATLSLTSFVGCSQTDTMSEYDLYCQDRRPIEFAADGSRAVGLYRATSSDGTVLIELLASDGTYLFMNESAFTIESGKYCQRSESKLCFLSNAVDAQEVCYDERIDKDGTWTSTEIGTQETVTIERLSEPSRLIP